MKNEIINPTTINALANKEIKSNLRIMFNAVETGKKATWQYAIAVAKIIGDEQYKEDFHDLKTFAEYVESTKSTLSQYSNAVAFMVRENLIPMKEQKDGKVVIDYAGFSLTVSNAYLLSVLSEEDFKKFREYCEENGIAVYTLSQNKLKATIKEWRESLEPEISEAPETDETEDSETPEEYEHDRPSTDTKEKALAKIAELMKQFDITVDEIAEQVEK